MNSARRAAALLAACALALGLALAAAAYMPARAFAATSSNEMTDSCPADGDAAVPTSGRYWVRFANNIAAVEGNLELASLVDADGNEVAGDACTISLADYELEFGYRQYLFFDVDGLEPGAEYHIVIEAGVTAKNGSASAQAIDIAFTTAAEGEEAATLAQPEEQAAGSGSGDGTGGSDGVEESSDAVVLTSWSVAGSAGDGRRQPYQDDSMAHYAALRFSANIGYYDVEGETGRALVEANAALVTLQRADGTAVEGVEVTVLFMEEDEQEGVVYLDLEGWLDPLSTYRIVVEPGLQTYWGEVSTERFVIEFTTDGQLSWGPTVFQFVAAACAVVAAAAGVASGLVRRARQRGVRR